MVKEQIRKGDVFGWLRTKFGKNIDLSIYESASEHIITNGLQRLLEAYGGDERKKWGLQNNGICLLLGWVNELIQQGKRDRVWQDLS